MSKAVNSKWKKIFPDTIGNQNRPATGVDDTQPFETGAFPQYIANDPVRYDLQNAAMSQLMSNDARLKEMVDARGKELDDHKVDPGAHKTGIAGNAATATKVVTTAAAGASANIAEATMASNDLARIRVSGETNAGELALETADDGSEPIVARQYTGIYTTPVRTAKILDESGNTSFPGTVVAPKFTGSLNGNSATATKLQTPRTLSLTGKAAGSATFDGSANASINVTSVNADTASKLSTARKINITGNASGSAAFDGSGNVSINTTVSQAAAASALNSMGRKTAIKDGTWEPGGLHLYQCYDNGYPTTYGNVISIGGAGGGELLAGWSGADKGIEHLYYRSRRDAGALWSDWRTVAFTSDINDYAPTKTGNGASGTWGISITGNAASATNADTVDGYHAQDILDNITAANVGGIIASALDTNGYVKFASGLLIVWGNGSAGNNEDTNGWLSATLPIKMSKIFVAVGNVSSGWGAPTQLGLSNDGTKILGIWDSCGSRCNSVRSFIYIAIGNA